MNTKLFILLMAAFSLSIISCSGDSDAETTTENPETYAPESSAETNPPGHGEPLPPKDPEAGETGYPDDQQELGPDLPLLELTLTVDDIVSYNVTTEAIVFNDLTFKKLTIPFTEGMYNRKSILYCDNKPLIEDLRVTYPVDSNPWYGFIVLELQPEDYDELSGVYNNYSFLLKNKTSQGQTDSTVDGEENAKKQKEAWDNFIKYMNDAGKLIK